MRCLTIPFTRPVRVNNFDGIGYKSYVQCDVYPYVLPYQLPSQSGLKNLRVLVVKAMYNAVFKNFTPLWLDNGCGNALRNQAYLARSELVCKTLYVNALCIQMSYHTRYQLRCVG